MNWTPYRCLQLGLFASQGLSHFSGDKKTSHLLHKTPAQHRPSRVLVDRRQTRNTVIGGLQDPSRTRLAEHMYHQVASHQTRFSQHETLAQRTGFLGGDYRSVGQVPSMVE